MVFIKNSYKERLHKVVHKTIKARIKYILGR